MERWVDTTEQMFAIREKIAKAQENLKTALSPSELDKLYLEKFEYTADMALKPEPGSQSSGIDKLKPLYSKLQPLSAYLMTRAVEKQTKILEVQNELVGLQNDLQEKQNDILSEQKTVLDRMETQSDAMTKQTEKTHMLTIVILIAMGLQIFLACMQLFQPWFAQTLEACK
jgi:hypothetical protein